MPFGGLRSAAATFIVLVSAAAPSQTSQTQFWGGLRKGMTPSEVAAVLTATEGVGKVRVKDGDVFVRYANGKGIPLFGVNTSVEPLFSMGRLVQVSLQTEQQCLGLMDAHAAAFVQALAQKYGDPPPGPGTSIAFRTGDLQVFFQKVDLGRPELPVMPRLDQATQDNSVLRMMYDMKMIKWKEQMQEVLQLHSTCSAWQGHVGIVRITYDSLSELQKDEQAKQVHINLAAEAAKKAAAAAERKRAQDAKTM